MGGGIVMKAFNLKEYLKNPERKVVTRDGRDVRIICTDFNNPDFPVIVEIKGNQWPLSFATNGEAIKERPLSCDLFFAPTKHEGWMNLYKKGFGLVIGDLVRNSEEAAKKIAAGDEDYITTIKVEWEE